MKREKVEAMIEERISGLRDEPKQATKSKGLCPNGIAGAGLMTGLFVSIVLALQVIDRIYPGAAFPIMFAIYGSLSVVQGYDFGKKHLRF